jgi:uncharacterized protein (TIGR02611 family)
MKKPPRKAHSNNQRAKIPGSVEMTRRPQTGSAKPKQSAVFSLAVDTKMTSKMASDLKQVRRLVVFVAGISVMLLGIVMLVAPGPGILTVALGLGILATEFIWARRLLKRFRRKRINITEWLFRRLAAISPVVRSQARRAPEASAPGGRRESNVGGQLSNVLERHKQCFFKTGKLLKHLKASVAQTACWKKESRLIATA